MDLSDVQFRVTETYVFTTQRMDVFGQAKPGHRPQTAHIIWLCNGMEMLLSVTPKAKLHGRPKVKMDIMVKKNPDMTFWNKILVF